MYAAKEAGAYEVIVVVGALAESVIAAVGNVTNVAIALNADWKAGLASSLAAGLEAAGRLTLDGILVMTTDQPLIEPASLRKLVRAFDAEHRIVASMYSGITGVPAVFGSEHFDDLMKLEGDQGAGRWLRSRPDVTTIEIESASIDIDTPADVDRLLLHKPGNEK